MMACAGTSGVVVVAVFDFFLVSAVGAGEDAVEVAAVLPCFLDEVHGWLGSLVDGLEYVFGGGSAQLGAFV